MATDNKEKFTFYIDPEQRDWLDSISDGHPFGTRGQAVRTALSLMEKVGPIKTLELLQED